MLDYVAKYEETSTTALSANPAVAVPLLTINGWILMQRKVPGGSVLFRQNWAEYRDGFGSAAGNDNYWLGLDKVYRLMQLGSVKLRIEVTEQIAVQNISHCRQLSLPFTLLPITRFYSLLSVLENQIEKISRAAKEV